MTDDQTTPDAETPEALEPGPDHDRTGCACGQDHSAEAAKFAAEMEAITTNLVALDAERRNLLTNSVLHKIEEAVDMALTALTAEGETPNPGVLQVLAVASASAGFLQILTEKVREENEDWTREKDAKVDAVWADFVAVVRKFTDNPAGAGAVRITPDDLPIDLMERVAKGEGTEADYEAVRKVVAEKAGLKPEDVDVERMFAQTKDGVQPVLTKDGKPVQKQQAAGFTQRRDDEGYPIDEDGHRYGGTYL